VGTDDPLAPVFGHLWDYTVAFAAISATPDDDAGTYSGMGTLVYADGPCMLTAAHVWELLRGVQGGGKENKYFGVHWKSDRKGHSFVTAHITPRTWPRPATGWGEWGPDLALLRLSNLDEADLKNRDKSFFNLDKPRSMTSPSTLWTLIGAPGEEVQPPTATDQEMSAHLHPVSDEEVAKTDRGGFDYIEIRAHYGSAGRPQSYRGLSGSGLWRIGWTRSPDRSGTWDETASLEGVAFFEGPQGADTIRCHGRTSIERARRLTSPDDPRLVRVG
jgi:hypothetical protein